MSKALLLYKDLLTEIIILEAHLKSVEREYNNVYDKSLMVRPKGVGAVDYGAERVTGGLVQVPYYDAVGKIGTVMNRYNEINKELQEKYVLRDEIAEHIESLEGLSYQVAKKKIIEGKPIKIIAKELKYSESFIKKISAKIDKPRKAI